MTGLVVCRGSDQSAPVAGRWIIGRVEGQETPAQGFLWLFCLLDRSNSRIDGKSNV
jgi:hypothetical protein